VGKLTVELSFDLTSGFHHILELTLPLLLYYRLSAFPALSHVAGDIYVSSTNYIDCTPFERLSANAQIGGDVFFCQGASSPSAGSPTALPSASASASSLSPSPHLSTDAKVGIGLGVAIGVLLILGGVLTCYFRRRRQTRSPAPTVGFTSERAGLATSTPSKVPVLNEIDGNSSLKKDREGRTEPETQELPA
jgi:hypothetical protein